MYWNLTYYPRCIILLAKHRSYPMHRGQATLANTLLYIAKMEIRPHWLRG
jgi:hypothetical protein